MRGLFVCDTLFGDADGRQGRAQGFRASTGWLNGGRRCCRDQAGRCIGTSEDFALSELLCILLEFTPSPPPSTWT